ncbi:MAG: patatin-like phospholipase family protein [Alphaproteobacteria bacterium]|nr:patatin-like phospholipase family protein [Alphaproteobacteria bacterium SS10]
MKRKTVRKAIADKPSTARDVNLALQGGGSHGAFTWGVIDRLLEAQINGEINIKSVSGTSAGAMNAAVLVYGLETLGPEGTRKLLDDFWTGVSRRNILSTLHEISTQLTGSPDLDHNPVHQWIEMWQGVLSPQQFNPLNQNPLRDLLEDTIDFDVLRDALSKEGSDRLFVGATNVTKGKPKVFHGDEISVDAVMASATLPDVFHPVEINGEYFWDGGYMVNPPLEALRFDDTDDIVLVQINSFRLDDKPTSKSDIANTANRLMFNSALVAELRAIEQLNHLFDAGMLKPTKDVRPQRMHRIIDAEQMRRYSRTAKSNTGPSFLKDLKMLGRRAADAWLQEDAPQVGKKSTWEANWANPIEHLGRSKLVMGPNEGGEPDQNGNDNDRWGRLRGAAAEALGDQPKRLPTVRLGENGAEPVAPGEEAPVQRRALP